METTQNYSIDNYIWTKCEFFFKSFIFDIFSREYNRLCQKLDDAWIKRSQAFDELLEEMKAFSEYQKLTQTKEALKFKLKKKKELKAEGH